MPGKPRLYLPYWGLWGDRVFTAQNPEIGARITYWIRDYTGDDVSIGISDRHDNPVVELTGTNHPGLNRVVWDLQPDKKDRFDNPDAMLGQTVFVPPGEYTVTISYGDRSARKTVQVLPAPGDG